MLNLNSGCVLSKDEKTQVLGGYVLEKPIPTNDCRYVACTIGTVCVMLGCSQGRQAVCVPDPNYRPPVIVGPALPIVKP